MSAEKYTKEKGRARQMLRTPWCTRRLKYIVRKLDPCPKSDAPLLSVYELEQFNTAVSRSLSRAVPHIRITFPFWVPSLHLFRTSAQNRGLAPAKLGPCLQVLSNDRKEGRIPCRRRRPKSGSIAKKSVAQPTCNNSRSHPPTLRSHQRARSWDTTGSLLTENNTSLRRDNLNELLT
jgi:hypothetical protein